MANATEEEQRQALRNSTPETLLKWDADFEQWAHDNQLPPSGEGWRTWLMMAGRGFGKTRAGAEWIFRLGNGKPKSRIALVGATMADARSIMVEGVSGLLSVARRYRRRLRWEPSLGRLSWPNGSQVQLFSGDNADGLRGPEHDFAWCAADTGFSGVGGGGGGPAQRSAPGSGDRLVLCRWLGANRGLGGKATERRRLYQRRLALHLADRRHERVRKVRQPMGKLPIGRVGDGDAARGVCVDRWRASRRQSGRADRFSDWRFDRR
jgi:hypothetical protein